MLFACGISGFCVWKHEQEKMLLEQSIKEKRKRLDEHYSYVLECQYRPLNFLNGQNRSQDTSFRREQIYNEIEKIEADMLQDGYDKAEIYSFSGDIAHKVDEWANKQMSKKRLVSDKDCSSNFTKYRS